MGSKKKKETELVLTIEDVFCIACRCIYLKPVTMPCGHTLCLDCFKNMVEITAYQCPTCRLRISNWLRKYKHKWDAMINEKLWAAMQKQFPSEIEKRLNDEDDGLEERIVSQGFNRISIEPGVIAKEFEIMKKQFEEEQQKIEIQNLELAKRIQEEEEANISKMNAVIDELNQTDLKLASQIQEEMENEANYQLLQNESDQQLAATLQNEISLALSKEKIVSGFNNKNKQLKEPNAKSGPLDRMLTKLKPKNNSFQNYQSRVDVSTSSTSSSSFYSDTSSSSSTINSGLKDDNLDMCTCGRLTDDYNTNEPFCKFCVAQIANFELITQQHNDYLLAKDLEKKLNCSNFENYNLRKRSSPYQLPNRKIKKLPKGQQTLSFKI